MTTKHTHTIPLYEREENVLIISARLFIALQRYDFGAVQDVVDSFFDHWQANHTTKRRVWFGRFHFTYTSVAEAIIGSEKLNAVIGASGIE